MRYYRITHLARARATSDIRRPDSAVQGLLDGFAYRVCEIGQAERVAEHHCYGEDGGYRVDDAFAGNVGRRTCCVSTYMYKYIFILKCQIPTKRTLQIKELKKKKKAHHESAHRCH